MEMIKLLAPSLDNEMEQKCDVPTGIHDAGTKFLKWWPCGFNQCLLVHLSTLVHLFMGHDICALLTLITHAQVTC